MTAGESFTLVDTDCGKLGIGICYDIRFPEMAAIYARKGAQLLVYPGEDPHATLKHIGLINKLQSSLHGFLKIKATWLPLYYEH